MEPGPDSKLSEIQTPELVKAGALRPWTVGDLPPAPEGGLAYFKKAVGPGLLCAGLFFLGISAIVVARV